MNTTAKSISVQTRATLELLGLALGLTDGFFAVPARAAAVPKLSFSDSPIARAARPALSYAPVVKRVSPRQRDPSC
jgi:hypothetical protein